MTRSTFLWSMFAISLAWTLWEVYVRTGGFRHAPTFGDNP